MKRGLFFYIGVLGFIGVITLPLVAEERLGRGLVALERKDGSVFLSWRLLKSDPEDVAFHVRRFTADSGGRDGVAVTNPGPYHLTNVVDKTAFTGSSRKTLVYELYKYHAKTAPDKHVKVAQTRVVPTGGDRSYLRIPLQGGYDFQKVTVSDLDGDGVYEYIIKQPNFNTDPYQHPGYWKRSTTTYKIEAYKRDGTMLWRHDMGWAIEAGIWYSPWLVYDVDGDGRAEVYCKAGEGDPRDEKGLVQSGPEYLVKLDGRTGKIVARTDWLSREGYRDYNRYCRNFLTVAYLDGHHPSLIMQRGTYNLIKIQALDKDFKRLWFWRSTDEKSKYNGQSSHGLVSADVDGDGRDELVIGAAVVDDDGHGLWTLQMGHPDVCHVGEIDPDNPGLEIFYGFETRQKTDGICVVDAQSGRKLWTHKEPTRHIHGQGMAGDVLGDYPGMEVYSGERDTQDRWLYSAGGKLIRHVEGGSLSPRPVWWDGDPTKEVVTSRAVQDWDGPVHQRLEGRLIAVMDCLGDYREEVITTLKGELRIYTTPIPTKDRRVCLMQDRQYRLGVVAQTMGYYYPAQLGQ